MGGSLREIAFEPLDSALQAVPASEFDLMSGVAVNPVAVVLGLLAPS